LAAIDSGDEQVNLDHASSRHCSKKVQGTLYEVWQTDRQTDRHFYLTSEKIRYQGEKNDRKVLESSSPAMSVTNQKLIEDTRCLASKKQFCPLQRVALINLNFDQTFTFF